MRAARHSRKSGFDSTLLNLTFASLIFSGRDWLVPVLALAGLGLAALVWGYARA
jgi:hypothetical protein